MSIAAGPFIPYTKAILGMQTGGINLTLGNLVMILVTNSYVPSFDVHSTFADVSAFEVATGLGYTRGGQLLPSVTDTQSGSLTVFTSAALSWTNFQATFRYAITLVRAGSSLVSTDKLVDCCDIGGVNSWVGSGSTLIITPNASGMFTTAHSP